jgi:branched-chain amino acid transport system ATP-binding protein
MAESALVIDRLSRRFMNFSAVSDVSVRVEVGERVAVVGPNGAGKTTLLNLIDGQVQPSAGSIECFGQDLTKAPVRVRAAAGVARSFQVPSLFPGSKVSQNVWFGLRQVGARRYGMLRRARMDADIPAVRDVLRRWGLWELRDALPGQLAYGERRRLELAMALSAKPRLLLLDEPTAGLTLREGAELVQHVNEFGRDVTVLLVDHDMSTVFAVAERIIVMHRGRILADGPPDMIRQDRAVAAAYGIEGAM